MKRFLGYAGLFIGTLAADLLTKQVVRHCLHVGESVRILGPIVKFTFIYNRNAVFGLPIGNQTLYTIFAILAVILIIVYFIKLPADQRWERVALAIILGGALGNLADRITSGRVVDFIEVGYGRFTWPIFNVADIAITIGMGILIFQMLFGNPKHRGSKNSDHRTVVRPGHETG